MQSQHFLFFLLRVDFLLLYIRRSIMSAGLLLTQSKDDINGRTDLHGLFIEQRWFVNPLLYSIESGLAKQRVPADHLEFLNMSIFADDGREFHRARNARALGD